MLSGCVTTQPDPGGDPLAVSLPATCEEFLTPVDLPPVDATTDARAAFVYDDAALLTANERISKGRDCLHDERNAYAGKGKPQ